MFITSLYIALSLYFHCLRSSVYSNIVLSGPVSCSLINKQTMDKFWVELLLNSFPSYFSLTAISIKRWIILKNAHN